jgi:AcrR family transcriptional regulator
MPAQLTDPRTRRSRSALEAALRELIAQRELHQISVSDLTKRAGVDRSTFYEHYTDVDDLAAAACTAVFDELVATVSTARRRVRDKESAVEHLTELFAHVAEHAALYRALLGTHGSARVINHLLRRITLEAHTSRADTDAEVPPDTDYPARVPHDPFAAFVAGAVLGSVIDWLSHDCPGTPEQMSAAIWPHLRGSAAADSPMTPPHPQTA